MESNLSKNLDNIYIYNRINLLFKKSLVTNYNKYSLIYTNDIDILNTCPNSRLLYEYPINFNIEDFTKKEVI